MTELKNKYDKLVKIHDATNEAVETLRKTLDEAAAENALLKRQLASCEQNLDQQKAIVRNHFDQAAVEREGLVAEIIELRTRLKGHE